VVTALFLQLNPKIWDVVKRIRDDRHGPGKVKSPLRALSEGIKDKIG